MTRVLPSSSSCTSWSNRSSGARFASFRNAASAGVIAATALSVQAANFVEWQFDSYSVEVGGQLYSVIDVYAAFDGTTDTVLNVFNAQVSNTGGTAFHHADSSTLSGVAGNWNVTQSLNLPTLGVVPEIDSFVLVGGTPGSTGNTTALDPNFDPSDAPVPPSDAGWFNSNPTNLQGRVDPSTLQTHVARFVIEGAVAGESLSFAANMGYNQGLGTDAQFAWDDPLGSGPPTVVAYACADSDGDGIDDCTDNCPSTSNAGQSDADGDGVGDACDGCPTDPNKTAPGVCGCGVADTDSDGDGTPDCNDGCPTDPNKIAPGVCGCGVADTDSDGDGTPDCNDGCPADPNKTSPGACGCGAADTDSDSDGTPDCNDGCPNDPNKIAPGVCGCGVDDASAETWYPDSDGDGYGNASSDGTVACEQPDGWVLDNTDCDDSNAAVNPAADEICDNAIDENCNGDLTDCGGADLVGFVGEASATVVEGVRYAVIDVFAEFDPTSVEVVNVYDSSISNTGGSAFVQNDFAGGSWSPVFSDPTLAAIDSFVTIGGEPGPASGNTTTLDPSFGDATVPVPPAGAGWYNSNPANLQGLSDSSTGRVLVGRFVIEQLLVEESLTFSGSLSFAEYPDGATQQESASVVVDYPIVECPSDLNADGVIDGADLGVMLLDWGSTSSSSDLDGNGIVDGADLGVMLLDWGGCL
jgi:hypothetical protein